MQRAETWEGPNTQKFLVPPDAVGRSRVRQVDFTPVEVVKSSDFLCGRINVSWCLMSDLHRAAFSWGI